MSSLKTFLFPVIALFIFQGSISAQRCEYWSPPVALSDSNSDNTQAVLCGVPGDNYTTIYYVFWIRFLEVFGTEIVCTDLYDPGAAESVLLAEGYTVSNPQAVSINAWNSQADTLAHIFYQTDQNGNEDIYYIVMTQDGFPAPVPFATSPEDETHLRLSPGGGMVWQEGDAIRYTKLNFNGSGYYFDPVVTIDEGACRNPDIQRTLGEEQYIAWEKGDPGDPEIWYSTWDYVNEEWGMPEILLEADGHSNPRFSKSMTAYGGWDPVLITDWQDSTGQYHFHLYDFLNQYGTTSDFTQDFSMEPDLFTIDFITDFFGYGYLAFTHDEGMGNRDVYSSDNGEVGYGFNAYCRLDQTPQGEGHPGLFEGRYYFDAFDLVCIWESFRNYHLQLFASTTLVIFGGVKENEGRDGPDIRVYPNPFGDFFWLEADGGISSGIDIELYNACGQLVRAFGDRMLSPGKCTVKIQANDLTPGLYLLKISHEDHSEFIRIIKKQ